MLTLVLLLSVVGEDSLVKHVKAACDRQEVSIVEVTKVQLDFVSRISSAEVTVLLGDYPDNSK